MHPKYYKKYAYALAHEMSIVPFGLKVSKSQKQLLLKIHCPKNERNIRQNSALEFKKWLNQKY